MPHPERALIRQDRGLYVAVAGSDQKDGAAAARHAVSQISQVLAGRRPTVLLVWNGDPSPATDAEPVIDEVIRQFPRPIVYGANGFAGISPYGVRHRVALMAIGGRVRRRAADAPCDLADASAAGAILGADLQRHVRQGPRDGHLILLMGNCHVPANDNLVKALQTSLPHSAPVVAIAGASHPVDGRCYIAGRPVRQRAVALLLSGAFSVRVSMASGDGVEGITHSARSAMEHAAGTGVTGVLVFDCAGRMGTLGDQRETEHQALIAGSKGAPFAGFYSSGEIGSSGSGQPAVGVGQHIVCCALQGR